MSWKEHGLLAPAPSAPLNLTPRLRPWTLSLTKVTEQEYPSGLVYSQCFIIRFVVNRARRTRTCSISPLPLTSPLLPSQSNRAGVSIRAVFSKVLSLVLLWIEHGLHAPAPSAPSPHSSPYSPGLFHLPKKQNRCLHQGCQLSSKRVIELRNPLNNNHDTACGFFRASGSNYVNCLNGQNVHLF